MKARGEGRIFRRKDKKKARKFMARKLKEGSVFWWCAYYLRGREYRESAEQTEVHADQIGAKPFIGPQQERIKVSELLDALEADYKLRGKESPQFKAHIKPVRDYFGDWRAVEVTAEAVDQFISELLEGDPKAPVSEKHPKAPSTANRSTQLLAQAYKLAIERRRLSNAPVIRHLSERGNARHGFFLDAEFRAVLDHLPEYLRDFSRFGYLTGWRKGEIGSLLWEDVDGDVIRLRAENSKNGEARTVTLDGVLAELMERRKAARQVKTKDSLTITALVFHHAGNPIVDFRKAWATACCMAGLGSLVCPSCKGKVDAEYKCANCSQEWNRENLKYVGRLFHDFRRTAVRNMVRAGVPERVAMTISGHKTRSIFDRYNIVSERDLRDAMQRTQAYLSAATQRERQKFITKRSMAIQ
jgi:integrase